MGEKERGKSALGGRGQQSNKDLYRAPLPTRRIILVPNEKITTMNRLNSRTNLEPFTLSTIPSILGSQFVAPTSVTPFPIKNLLISG